MDPIYKPLTKDEKAKLVSKGYKEWEYFYFPRWADPDDFKYHLGSGVCLTIAIIGRQVARKTHQPSFLFTANILLIPLLYIYSYRLKNVDKKMNQHRKRPSFAQNLEFYPVTRRAWNRALAIRTNEMVDIKQKVAQLI